MILLYVLSSTLLAVLMGSGVYAFRDTSPRAFLLELAVFAVFCGALGYGLSEALR